MQFLPMGWHMKWKSLLMQGIALLSVFMWVSSASFAETATPAGNCTQYNSPFLKKPVPYCVVRSRPDLPANANEPVVYYFHGIGGDHRRFFTDGYTAAIDRISRAENFPPMTFISFATERLSYHINRNESTRAYQKWFLEEFTPFIEKKYNLCQQRECRGLFGNSMGGIGTFFFAFHHPDKFGVLANNAPVIVPYNIFDSIAKWDAYFERHPIWRAKGYFLLGHTRYAFRSRENFSQHQVLDYAKNVDPNALPKMYFDAGGKDEYGFDEGHFLLKEILDHRGVTYRTDFYPAGEHEIMAEPWRAERALRFFAENLTH